MKSVRRTTVTLMLAIAMVLGSLFTFSAPAMASSDYDSLLQTTSTLSVSSNDGVSENMDISQSWWTDFQQSYALRVQQNIGFPTNFVTTLQSDINSGGSWGVFSTTSTYGNLITILGTDDPDATCEFSGPADTGNFVCSSHAGYGFVEEGFYTNSSFGGNGCYGSGMSECSSDGMDIYSSPVVATNNGSGYTMLQTPDADLASVKFFVMNFDIQYPSGYAGVVLPSTRHNATSNYVAMGDSYSSGEGNSPYDPMTNMDGIDQCHRSMANAYPDGVANSDDLNLDFVACSGATTDTLLNGGTGEGAWNEPAQTGALSSSTSTVTLTIGGNDMGFGEVVQDCADNYGCSADTTLQGNLDDRLAALSGTGTASINGHTIHSLLSVYEAIHTAAGNATIYVGGYPRLFGSDITNYTTDSSANGGAVCDLTPGTISYDDAQWMNTEAGDLNSAINTAVNAAHADGINIVYVPASFGDHSLCDSDTSWLYGALVEVSTSPPSYNVLPGSLHPTGDGQVLGYATSFLTAMAN